MNYHNKRFRAIQNSPNGEVSGDLVFHYQQDGDILSCDYAGGQIKKGHLIGLVDSKGQINMRYHQINERGEMMTGKCQSTPEVMDSGKIKLHESWQWTSGDLSRGTSTLEEV